MNPNQQTNPVVNPTHPLNHALRSMTESDGAAAHAIPTSGEWFVVGVMMWAVGLLLVFIASACLVSYLPPSKRQP